MFTEDENGRILLEERDGYKILLTKTKCFLLLGDDYNELFNTFDGVEKKIEQLKRAKTQTTKKKLCLMVLDENGCPDTITGIHMNSGALLGPDKKKTDQFHLSFYPMVEKLKPLLEARRNYKEKIDKLNTVLDKYRIKNTRHYGRIIPDDYPKCIEILETEYQEKKTAIEQADLDKEVEEVKVSDMRL